MPTKSNNIGGRGGARPGAGRKKTAVKKKPTNKDLNGMELETLEIPEVEGVDMPKPHAFLSAEQRDGSALQAEERWIQCEEMTNRMGFLSKHPTTQKPITSPFINIGINYMNQASRLWSEIDQIVKEHGGTYGGNTSPEDDLMERLLRARKG